MLGKAAKRIYSPFLKRLRQERLQLSVYYSLVDSLFGTIGAFMTLSLAGCVLATLVYYKQPDFVTIVLSVALVVITAGRLWLLIRYQTMRKAAERMRLKEALRLEAVYACLGISLMVCISVLSAYGVFTTQDRMIEALASAMVLAIGAIIASRNGGRPLIVKWQTIGLCLPYGATLLLSGRADLRLTGFIIVLFYFAILSASRTAYKTLREALVNGRKAASMSAKVNVQAKLLGAALNNMSTALMMFDKDDRLLVSNAKACQFFGEKELEGLIGQRLKKVAEHIYVTVGATDREVEKIRSLYHRVSEITEGFTFDLSDHRRGRSFDVRLNRIEDGGFVVSVDDITERKLKDHEIERLAHRDPLTDLHNRYSLLERMKEWSVEGTRRTTAFYLDLDGFKVVNDGEGHTFGDKLLNAIADRLRQTAGPGDVVSRIGGDEFFILIGGELTTEQAELCSTRILQHVAQPAQIDGKQITITASIGIAQVVGAFDPEILIKRADVALYEAKARGRNRWIHFEHEMEERAALEIALQAELKLAITNDELDLVYQPIVDSDTGRTVCCEALMRWYHPTRGTVAPVVFIPLAEESGLINELGAWALRRACRDAATWPDQNLKVAVNLSATQFKGSNGSVAAAIESALISTGFDPNRLEVEITESVLANDIDRMRQELEAIHVMGVSIALDDFGTGYSSLNYIHKLPINKVKLDRSFVIAIAKDQESVKFIASIVQMAQTLRKELVIEGVETAEELALLRSVNARIIQGFHFSKPLSRNEICRYIAASNLTRGFHHSSGRLLQRSGT